MKPSGDHLLLMEGVVGSQAYGLATPSSDIDRLGIYAVPTEDFWYLNKPAETMTGKDEIGDYTYHEAEKYVRLALKCNPTILELLWLDHEYLSVHSLFGESLIWKRSLFLSQEYVRGSYLGYATQQLERIRRRNTQGPEEEWGPTRIAKDAKNARHLWRLCDQGVQLWMYGHMDVKLSERDADICRHFGETVGNTGDLEPLRAKIHWAETLFNSYSTPLPDEPDTASIETWLLNIRRAMLVPSTQEAR